MGATSLDQRPDWDELIRQQLESGKSERAFCREHDISPDSLNYQKRKRRAAERPTGFIPIKTTAPPTPTDELHLELELPFGITLRLRGQVQ